MTKLQMNQEFFYQSRRIQQLKYDLKQAEKRLLKVFRMMDERVKR